MPLGVDHRELGRVRIDGARLAHADAPDGGSSELLAFVAHQIDEIVQPRSRHEVRVVAWGKIDDEQTEQYLSLAAFAGLARPVIVTGSG